MRSLIKPDLAEVGDEALEHHLPEQCESRRGGDELRPFLAGQLVLEPLLVHFEGQESVAHQESHLEGPILALPSLAFAERVSEMVAKSEHAVVHVPCLVLDDHLEELLEERFLRHLIHRAKRAEGQAFDHDLHPRNFTSHRESWMRASMMTKRLSLI